MPMRKNPKKPKPAERILRVTLTPKERIEIGRALLGIKDGLRRQNALKDLEGILGRCASSLANVDRMELPSDHKAATRPLARAAERFQKVLEASNQDVLLLMRYFKYADWQILSEQLSGIERYLAWLNSYPSKRGGERRAYARRERAAQSRIFGDWFDRNRVQSRLETNDGAKKSFVLMAEKAVERTLREAEARGANRGKN